MVVLLLSPQVVQERHIVAQRIWQREENGTWISIVQVEVDVKMIVEGDVIVGEVVTDSQNLAMKTK